MVHINAQYKHEFMFYKPALMKISSNTLIYTLLMCFNVCDIFEDREDSI